MPKLPSVPRIAITATGRTPAALLDATRRALGYTRFVELRLDWVPDPDEVLRALPTLLRRFSAKRPLCIATCRRKPNGGEFRGTVAAQLAILEQAADAGCRLTDLEIESAESLGQDRVASLRRRAGLILSFHDFQRMPRPEPVARRLQRFPADFYKLVGTATRQSDNCVVLEFLQSRLKPEPIQARERPEPGLWVAFCMGETGIPSRILALSRGSRFVYAALPPESVLSRITKEPRVPNEPQEPQEPREPKEPNGLAAPGQLDWDSLRSRYMAHKLTPQSAIYGLVGSPVAQSIGAAIHNAALRSRRLDGVYIPFLVNSLRDFRKAAARYPLAGFSVTIPHKQRVLRAADKTDPLTRSAGAANTVRVTRTNRWEAINTDIQGIVTPLRRAFRLAEGAPLRPGFRAVILGNGGAARAAVLALRLLQCSSIQVAGRNPARVRRFVRELGVSAMPLERLAQQEVDLLVQTTPVGMWPRTAESPLQPEQITARVVFDLIYNPPVTRLLQLARSKGCRTISGLEMFLSQAAGQFGFWTKREAPVRWMRRVAIAELRRFQTTGTADAGTE